MNVIVEGQPAVDVGGVCRTFFQVCMIKLSQATWIYLKGRVHVCDHLSSCLCLIQGF